MRSSLSRSLRNITFTSTSTSARKITFGSKVTTPISYFATSSFNTSTARARAISHTTHTNLNMSSGIPSADNARKGSNDLGTGSRLYSTTSGSAHATSGSVGTEGFSELGIENTNVHTAPGVELNQKQKVVVGSVLDLFAGLPSLEKLSLWSDNAVFADQITNAEGRKQYSAQWFGLKAVCTNIERLGHEVTSAGNPIEMDLKTKYVLKGGMAQTVESKVSIWTEEQGGEGKITKVQDAWNGNVPSEGFFVKALRNLNSVVVPVVVSVPKNGGENA
ncbi:uncharacterized protein Bfra_010497 [Botrytis fragariae]|uniref:Uncharacterized protein n=1 Tax=Botrytis fragariae TaxID=1964551 RepID=A0A8H6AHW7_9HELO|nr:uncharacterized protein Bfra_010497 [Botrytis fragariae]KAF5867523.1 hypothetical protein Bfra_010497 [Botrytis fragariae]